MTAVELIRKVIQDAEHDALEEEEKRIYQDLLKLDNLKDQVDGLLDFGWNHEQILNALRKRREDDCSRS